MNAQERCVDLLALKDNWDSYGAPPISSRAVGAAAAFLENVAVVPTNSGGVQLEWHLGGLHLEVEFDREGGIVPQEKP